MNPIPKDWERVELLANAVEAARRAKFWRLKLGDASINSLDDFKNLPIVESCEYRRRRFTDLVAYPDEIEWIPGPWLGQSGSRAPVAEGDDDARRRVRILREALSGAIPKDVEDPGVVVLSTFDNRYFGAEMCAAFARMNLPAHLIADCGARGLGELRDLLSKFEPDVVALLSRRLDVDELPDSVRHVVTVNADRLPENMPFLDLYVFNEFGVLGARRDEDRYRLAHDSFYFENSSRNTLVVTPYFSRAQPIIRLDTGDAIHSVVPANAR